MGKLKEMQIYMDSFQIMLNLKIKIIRLLVVCFIIIQQMNQHNF